MGIEAGIGMIEIEIEIGTGKGTKTGETEAGIGIGAGIGMGTEITTAVAGGTETTRAWIDDEKEKRKKGMQSFPAIFLFEINSTCLLTRSNIFV
jgi:hypothetical protein